MARIVRCRRSVFDSDAPTPSIMIDGVDEMNEMQSNDVVLYYNMTCISYSTKIFTFTFITPLH